MSESGSMKRCDCGAASPASSTFCIQCGTALDDRHTAEVTTLQRACCKSSLKAGMKFCTQCGRPTNNNTPGYQLPEGLTLPAGLLIGAVLFLFFGLTLPAFTMHPSLGGGFLEWWVDVFTDEITPKTFSILGGIGKLFAEGDVVIAVIILTFSVIFPMAKALLLLIIVGNEGGLVSLSGEISAKLQGKGLKYASYLGKYSMVDVFVISVIVVVFKGFPGGTRVDANVGIFCFAIQVVLSLVGTHYLKRYLENSSRDSINT